MRPGNKELLSTPSLWNSIQRDVEDLVSEKTKKVALPGPRFLAPVLIFFLGVVWDQAGIDASFRELVGRLSEFTGLTFGLLVYNEYKDIWIGLVSITAGISALALPVTSLLLEKGKEGLLPSLSYEVLIRETDIARRVTDALLLTGVSILGLVFIPSYFGVAVTVGVLVFVIFSVIRVFQAVMEHIFDNELLNEKALDLLKDRGISHYREYIRSVRFRAAVYDLAKEFGIKTDFYGSSTRDSGKEIALGVGGEVDDIDLLKLREVFTVVLGSVVVSVSAENTVLEEDVDPKKRVRLRSLLGGSIAEADPLIWVNGMDDNGLVRARRYLLAAIALREKSSGEEISSPINELELAAESVISLGSVRELKQIRDIYLETLSAWIDKTLEIDSALGDYFTGTERGYPSEVFIANSREANWPFEFVSDLLLIVREKANTKSIVRGVLETAVSAANSCGRKGYLAGFQRFTSQLHQAVTGDDVDNDKYLSLRLKEMPLYWPHEQSRLDQYLVAIAKVYQGFIKAGTEDYDVERVDRYLTQFISLVRECGYRWNTHDYTLIKAILVGLQAFTLMRWQHKSLDDDQVRVILRELRQGLDKLEGEAAYVFCLKADDLPYGWTFWEFDKRGDEGEGVFLVFDRYIKVAFLAHAAQRCDIANASDLSMHGIEELLLMLHDEFAEKVFGLLESTVDQVACVQNALEKLKEEKERSIQEEVISADLDESLFQEFVEGFSSELYGEMILSSVFEETEVALNRDEEGYFGLRVAVSKRMFLPPVDGVHHIQNSGDIARIFVRGQNKKLIDVLSSRAIPINIENWKSLELPSDACLAIGVNLPFEAHEISQILRNDPEIEYLSVYEQGQESCLLIVNQQTLGQLQWERAEELMVLQDEVLSEVLKGRIKIALGNVTNKGEQDGSRVLVAIGARFELLLVDELSIKRIEVMVQPENNYG
ncbi:MAG: hypothetical protein KZQ90_11295 [Candidatus Thiodiazotropha sp. (ex Codakia rugifera)]|nr:hypothetical protein [Candidatus Thiodiazotropha sp. (ex Codakia rugifera)]